MRRIRDFDVASAFERLAAFSVRRAVAVAAAVAVLSLVALLLALRLDPSAATSTLVDRDTSSSKATEELHRTFGDEPIVVLVRGRLTGLLLTQDIARLLGLEGCISGNAPPGAKSPAPVCREFAERKPVQVVYGPGTFINEAAGRILDQLGIRQGQSAAEADRAAGAAARSARRHGLGQEAQAAAAQRARDLVNGRFARQALELSLRFGLNSVPALNNPDFVLQLVFDPALGAEVPKPRFAYVFPNKDASVIQARLRPGLSDSERKRTIAMVREAVGSSVFKLKFGSYVVSGVPVVTEGVASRVSGALAVLLVAAVIVMAATLAVVFRTRRRLLPLVLALAAASLTFGVMSVVGASLTIASIAVLPVLIGLAVDYAIQFQARFDEARREAHPDPAGASPPRAAAAAARAGGPVIATAGIAAAAGFLVLLLSPVPMVRSFGALLVVGIVLAFAIAATLGFALLGGEAAISGELRRRLAFVPRLPRLRFSLPGGRALSRHPRRATVLIGKWGRGAFSGAIRRPRRVLWIAVLTALVGWVAGTQISVVSDLTKLVPQDQREVRDVKTLQQQTGVSGDISVLVHADDLADPRVIAWMADYQSRVLRRHGYRTGHTCRQAQLCPALSLTNLFGGRLPQSKRQARALFATLPRYFSQNVISKDQRTANMAFGIRVMPLDDQKKLVDDLRSQLNPPPGVRVELAGLPVLAAEANSDLESSRWLLGLAALVAVFCVLLAVYRRLEHAIVPLVPIALATGWSSLVLFLLQIPLNPMSATLGALVIAITTEFSVILASRYREERAGGLAPHAALEVTYARTGAAVLASGATATAGFAALIVSDVRMLRDFGFVTVVDLAVALVGVMLVLPAALLLAEEGVRIPRTRAEAWRALRALPGLVRRAAPAARRRLRASALFKK